MNRRQFSQSVSLGAVGAVALARAAEVSNPAKSEKKQWAHEHLKGLGSLIMPSFTADFKGLDEEAVRLDVARTLATPFEVRIRWVEQHGSRSIVHADLGGTIVKATIPPDRSIPVDSLAWLGFTPRLETLLDGANDSFLR